MAPQLTLLHFLGFIFPGSLCIGLVLLVWPGSFELLEKVQSIRDSFGESFMAGTAVISAFLVVSYFVGNLLSPLSTWLIKYTYRKGEANYERYLKRLMQDDKPYYDQIYFKAQSTFGIKNLLPSRLFNLCWNVITDKKTVLYNQAMNWWYLAVSTRNLALAILLPWFLYLIISKNCSVLIITILVLMAFIVLLIVNNKYDDRFNNLRNLARLFFLLLSSVLMVILALLTWGNWIVFFITIFTPIAFIVLLIASIRYDDHLARDVFDAFYSLDVLYRDTPGGKALRND